MRSSELSPLASMQQTHNIDVRVMRSTTLIRMLLIPPVCDVVP